jgi:outer membrane protein TolC
MFTDRGAGMRRLARAWVATVGMTVPAAAQPPTTLPPLPTPTSPRPVIAQSGIGPPPAALAAGAGPKVVGTAAAEPGERVHPITLATALKLVGSRALDVQIADQQVAIASRQLDRAKLLWVPNLVTGIDYFRHEGGQQNFAGDIVRSSRGTFAVGVGPNAVVSLTDAIYSPLAARQDLKARHAARRTAENDTTLSVAEAYFTAQQARGELAGAMAAQAKAEEVAAKAEMLAEGLAPPLEASRAKVELARRQQAVATARERWRTASADLVRLLRLEPGTLVEPVEAAFLPVTIIDPSAPLDSLIPVALTTRPELAGQQAVVQATLARLKREQMRPLVPSVALRSTATNPSGSIGWGGFGGGPNDRMQSFGSRFDLDLQVVWEFDALGLGNKARVGERRAEHLTATLELFRTQDRIAAEVSTAFAQARAAAERMAKAEPALKEAVELVEKSLLGMGQTKRVGDTNTLIVRPLEVVTAVQAFAQANADFYAAVADYNRGQFRLYRALGHPTDPLASTVEAKAPAVPVTVSSVVAAKAVSAQVDSGERRDVSPPVLQHTGERMPRRSPEVTLVKAERVQTIGVYDLPIARLLLSRPVAPVPAAEPVVDPAVLPAAHVEPLPVARPTTPATDGVWGAAAVRPAPTAEPPAAAPVLSTPSAPETPRTPPPAPKVEPAAESVEWGKAKGK